MAEGGKASAGMRPRTQFDSNRCSAETDLGAPRERDMKRLAKGIEDLGTEDVETFSYQLVEVQADERRPAPPRLQ
jgi:hypothetical protein